MNIVVGLPPNFEAIDAVFHIRRINPQRLAICYGDTVYQPKPWDMPADFVLHEKIHSGQQSGIGAEAWWDRYLVDTPFRLDQEIAANRAQWRALLDSGASRPMRRQQLAHMAKFLSGPVYGHMVTLTQAKREITGGMAPDH